MEVFLKYKTVILRTVGVLMLVIGFSVHFWVTPKEGLSANQRAAANVARMEAKIAGKAKSSRAGKKDESKFLKELKDTQAKQIKYLTIIAMIFGVGFLGFSFVKKPQEDK